MARSPDPTTLTCPVCACPMVAIGMQGGYGMKARRLLIRCTNEECRFYHEDFNLKGEWV